ncbi:MAG: hypothetical protein WC788_04910 [Candidatus Paceibacterota bacterium]|jgi:hypothetical protein
MIYKHVIKTIALLFVIFGIITLLFISILKSEPEKSEADSLKSEPEKPEADSLKSEPEKPNISQYIKTNKRTYAYGEPVEITVLDGIGGVCRMDIAGTRPDVVYSQTRTEFKMDSVSKNPFIWDQQSREFEWDIKANNYKYFKWSIYPDDYRVLIFCSVRSGPGGLGGGYNIRDSATITIEEPTSCMEKRIEIIKQSSDLSKNIYLKIKNTGTRDVDNVEFYAGRCKRGGVVWGGTALNYKDFLRNDDGIKAGETKEYTLNNEDNCEYDLIYVHIYECYDGNPDTWSKIVPKYQ